MKDLAITDVLLHRPPFLFVDKIEEADEKHTVGRYTYKEDEFFFKGHFPEHPVVPGVLLIELMAQVGGAGCAYADIMKPGLFVLATVEKVKFKKQVRPLDTCIVNVENVRVSTKLIRQKGTVTVDNELAATATWLCVRVDSEE
ncbi:MAG: 3-hydroxyacyl-ACP dehydratase FabZ [Sphaerochaetaceae bacterium]|nr:3-hydroxyacyl-ACP dehydratase FabZ [Sphaerochaetaceae bacterium]